MKTVAALESTHLRGPIRGQYPDHMITLTQSKAVSMSGQLSGMSGLEAKVA